MQYSVFWKWYLHLWWAMEKWNIWNRSVGFSGLQFKYKKGLVEFYLQKLLFFGITIIGSLEPQFGKFKTKGTNLGKNAQGISISQDISDSNIHPVMLIRRLLLLCFKFIPILFSRSRTTHDIGFRHQRQRPVGPGYTKEVNNTYTFLWRCTRCESGES